jgi:hypothetical protein
MGVDEYPDNCPVCGGIGYKDGHICSEINWKAGEEATMARGDLNLTIEMSEDALLIFTATRVTVCQALKCKHHILNNHPQSGRAECTLKLIYIDEDGKCAKFESKEQA